MTAADDAREARRLAAQAHQYTYGDGGDPVTGAALAAEAQVYATLALTAAMTPRDVHLETEPGVAYVYRAAWGMTPLGTYTNAEAARMHCEADAINHNPEYDTGHVFDWLGDESEPDDPYELVIGKDGVEETTDYTVTRIEVATEYDPEADA
ncbi:hypothetical protein AB0I94_02195 [Streptomyces sp. NPDC050147]|uniref:hypothetical protein n=1 Tax=Streptomyces sp. NPDC050147 TaxID=3155513 RepID=UPI00343E2FB8